MTTENFIFILIEAFAHQDPEEFFRARQKLWHKNEQYSRKGFNEGLLRTFKWLNYQVHLPDRRRGQLKLPDGQIIDKFIENDEQLRELKSKGELSFPFLNFILVCRKSDNTAILILHEDSMAVLWKHLFNYLNPYSKEFLPPPPMSAEEKLPIAGPIEMIFVPETISRHFQPLDSDYADLDGNRTLALPETTQALPDLLPFALPSDRRFTIREASLILIYSGVLIDREISDKYARCFGHSSGEKLYQDYSHYSSVEKRRRMCDTQMKSINKIKLFKGILPYLPENKKKAAEKDIEIMKKNYAMDFDEDFPEVVKII